MIISDGPFDKELVTQWAEEVRRDYPDYEGMNDRAPILILGALEGMSSQGSKCCFEIAFDGQTLFGLLAYLHLKEIQAFSLLRLGVLPPFRRRGIGTALVEAVQKKASTIKIPIFAGGVLEEAFPLLKKLGFWKVRERDGDPLYKWSDLPEHQNNYVPGLEDED